MFYLTLPSNSSLKYYPDNNASHFITKLPQTQALNGEYEVGLAEIQFSNNYLNVRESQVYFTYKGPEKAVSRKRKKKITSLPRDVMGFMKAVGEIHESLQQENSEEPEAEGYVGPNIVKCEMNAGLYESNKHFVSELNKLAEILGKRVKFHYNAASKKASVTLYEDSGVMRLSDDLYHILKLPSTVTGVGTFEAEHMMDLDQSFKSVFVYSDLVHPRPVGDVVVPLLRTLPPIDKTQETVHHLFEKPHYIPLGRFQFDTVEILLTTDKGEQIAFVNGHTIATLHFRRRRLM